MKKEVFTVSEINRYIKGLLQLDPRLRNMWVGGELSNFKLHRSGHMYFTIKDARSSLRCVFFRGHNQGCPFLPADGMEVWARGNISVYEKDGIYQFYVEEMEPAGKGSLYQAFEKLKKQLEEEGFFEARHKKRLPPFPRCIGLVTSPTGAALQDILTTVKRRFPHVKLLVAETLVQGSRAPADIVRSLEYFNGRDDVEIIVMARGGGSLEELWAFNTEEVARAVFASAVPVVSAVGHETDFTIADFVADLRASTPTAAAEIILPHKGELLQQIDGLAGRSGRALQTKLKRQKERLEYTVRLRLMKIPSEIIPGQREHCRRLHERQGKAITQTLRDRAQRLDSLRSRLEGLSPMQIMQRGYSYCEDEKGNILRSVTNIKRDHRLKLSFVDGKALCKVEEVTKP